MTPSADEVNSPQGWPCALISAADSGLIVTVNDTFLEWSGYTGDELVGQRRLRDLLSAGGRILYDTHLGPLLTMRGRVHEVALDLVRADGRLLPVLLNAAMRQRGGVDAARSELHVALFAVTERRSYERELMEARRTAEVASAASELAQRRLSLIADVNLILSGTLEIDVAMARLATMLARERAGCCVVLTFANDRRDVTVASAPTGDGHTAALAKALAAAARATLSSPLGSQERPSFPSVDLQVAQIRPSYTAAGESDGPELGFGPTMVMPVHVRGHHIATLVLTRPDYEPGYAGSDLVELAGLSDRIGLFIDNLQLFAREHERAFALQQALLTPPATPPGLDIVTRYLPNADGAMVGGDWYDAFVRPDGATVIVIGDVTGHDHVAAAAMGQLRGLLRAVAYTGSRSPADVLGAVDSVAVGLGVTCLATAFVAVISEVDPRTSRRSVTWSSAGHLPAALMTHTNVVLLDTNPDLLLGVDPTRARHDHGLDWDPDATLLLYTDGLVEDAQRSLTEGLSALTVALADIGNEPLDILCDRLVHRLSNGQRSDDIAILAIRNSSGRQDSAEAQEH
ncbi:MAG: putative sensor protein [Pseudonocardiales bacterium]|nr:putative sensor protein [Pseudonocardiales bacterium]